MDKVKKFLASPTTTVLLFALAAVLLLSSTVGGARAAINAYSDTYNSEVATASAVEVELLENGAAVSGSDALLAGLTGGQDLLPGKTYSEELSVRNSGGIDQFVRVTVYRYWEDGSGKRPDLDSALIQLGFAEGQEWLEDKDAATDERTVLYRSSVLAAGQESGAFLDSVTIDGSVIHKATQESKTADGVTTITTSYDYDGAYFRVLAIVDAVQTHNGAQAVKSAWGPTVTVSGDTLSLGGAA